MTPSPERNDLLPGTLDMLILKTLSTGTMHGYGIAQHIQRVSNDVLLVQEGSLYPALQRMQLKGWLRSEWKQTDNNRRARYYTITAAGRKQLGQEQASFGEVLTAIGRVMRSRA
jgi:PadR family transcriptional regulator, regulatory protein PadR